MPISDWKKGQNLTMLTAYDYSFARILSKTSVDALLVGDSSGMVMLGYPDTKKVTIDDMILFGAAVKRGAPEKLVIIDMPVGSYDLPDLALYNARRALEETRADAVKIEGMPDIAKALTEAGIPVMGHTGLLPQTAESHKVVGGDGETAAHVREEAKLLDEAGVFALVLECVPAPLAAEITASVKIPTIGIGAGNSCDGQVLVTQDLLGMNSEFNPKFLRKYATMESDIKDAVHHFIADVKAKKFPTAKESY